MSLYHKYRPFSLDSILGNENVIESLSKMLDKPDNCPHVFLISGPTGCGKTTIGRIIANKLNCVGSDFRELDSADFRGIDTVREIRKQSQYKPLESPCRVWLMDECHKLTNDAQNALLKILEDTPKHIYFILCTTDPKNLLDTIKGRCIQFQMNPLSENQMFKLLRRVVKSENESLSKEIYDQIIIDSFGQPRNALQILEVVLTVEPDKRLQAAKKQAEQQSKSIELCRVLLTAGGWKRVMLILNGLKDQEPESIRRHVLGYCQAVLLKEDNVRAGRVMEEFIEPFYNTGFAGLVYACYSIIKS